MDKRYKPHVGDCFIYTDYMLNASEGVFMFLGKDELGHWFGRMYFSSRRDEAWFPTISKLLSVRDAEKEGLLRAVHYQVLACEKWNMERLVAKQTSEGWVNDV